MSKIKENNLLHAIMSIRQLANQTGSTEREIVDYAYEHLPVIGQKRTVLTKMRKVLNSGVILGVFDKSDDRYTNNIHTDELLGVNAENDNDGDNGQGNAQGGSKVIDIIDLTGDDSDEEVDVTDNRLDEVSCNVSVSDFQSDCELASEAGTEVASEAGTEVASEAGTEVASEAGTEVASEAGTEVASEAGTEVASEAGTEVASEAGMEVDTDSDDEASDGKSDKEGALKVAKRKRRRSVLTSSGSSTSSSGTVSLKFKKVRPIISDKEREKLPRKRGRFSPLASVSGQGCSKMADTFFVSQNTKPRYSIKHAVRVLNKAIALQIAKQNSKRYPSTGEGSKFPKKTEREANMFSGSEYEREANMFPGEDLIVPRSSKCDDNIQATKNSKLGKANDKGECDKTVKVIQKVVIPNNGIVKDLQSMEARTSEKNRVGRNGEVQDAEDDE